MRRWIDDEVRHRQHATGHHSSSEQSRLQRWNQRACPKSRRYGRDRGERNGGSGRPGRAGSFSLNVVGVLPYATANFAMRETDISSTRADFLITWLGDLGTAGQVQWFDLGSSNQLDIINFAGGTSRTTTVDITDANGVANIGIDAEVDAASIVPAVPEPSSLLLLGSGVISLGGLLRKRWLARG